MFTPMSSVNRYFSVLNLVLQDMLHKLPEPRSIICVASITCFKLLQGRPSPP